MSPKPRSPLHALIGRRVRLLRFERGMTQAGLASRVGCSNHFVSGIERGVDSPSLHTLEKLARALGTTVAYLVDEREETRPTAQYDLENLLRAHPDPQLVRVLRDVAALYDTTGTKKG